MDSPRPSGILSRRRLLLSGGMLLTLQAALPRNASGMVLRQAAERASRSLCLATSQTSYPPQLERFIAMLDPAGDAFPAEQCTAEIEAVLAAWSAALCRKQPDPAALGAHLAATLTASRLDQPHNSQLRSSGALRIDSCTFDPPQVLSRDEFLKGWTSYLSAFTALEIVELEIFGATIVSKTPLHLDTELRCDLLGTNQQGEREQRTGSWTLGWTRDAQRWRVTQWKAGREVRSRLKGPGFTDITGHCVDTATPGIEQLRSGIDDWRTALDGACGIDVYGNHGIAVGDIDGSGFDSFYVCQPSGLPNRLYRNRGDGGFDDITERSGTGILDGTASALFADFLNRGRQDLLVVRTGGPLLFTNLGDGRFELRPDAFHFARPPQGTFTSVAAADYNRDGLLDVYFCVYSYYQGLNQYQFPSPYYDAQNGPPNFLFRNRGDGTFEDVTSTCGIDQNNNRFSFAAAWCDYDNNGWPDLYVANDFGRKNLYRNNGDGTFTDIAATAGVEDYGPGMSVCWIDHDNDGRQDLYVANMWLMEGNRITHDPDFLSAAPAAVRAMYQKHNAGNSLYRNRGDGGFDDRTAQAGSAMARWSWSCAAWDFDNDGCSDLYVANGFVSGPNHHDLQSFFWRQVASRSYFAEGASQEYELAWNAVNELVRSDFSWSGYERNVFYANNGDGTFSDVSGVLGLDFRDDSRAYALSDFDHDGRLEFVLKNRTAPQLRILHNDLELNAHAVVFRLRGHTSNRDAIGALLTIESGAPRQTKFVEAGSGFASQHTKELFFGLGSPAAALTISVRWPAGHVQRFENVPIDRRIDIEEGTAEFKATAFRTTPTRKPGLAAPLQPPPPAAVVNTWLVAPLFAPDWKLADLRGEIHQLSTLRGRPVLLTFFGLGCGASEQQLMRWNKALPQLDAAGLGVLAIAAGTNSASAALDDFARANSIRFPILRAGEKQTGAWNILYRYLFDRRRDLPLPASFLLNRDGAVIRIYQGIVDPSQLVEDWKTAPDTAQQHFARAMPFNGPYYGNPMRHNYFTYGVAFVEYGYLYEAREAFQRVVDSEPGYANAWFNLGTIYLNQKLYPDARRCLREATRLNPKFADAWNNLGKISGEEGNYEQALREFREAARANPNYMLAVQNMVGIYQYQGRAVEAQQALEELVELAPGNADLHLGLGMAFAAQDQQARAREELETAIRLQPGHPEALNNLGVLLLKAGLAQQAVERFEQARLAAPEFDRPYINLALIYRGAGQVDKARELLEGYRRRHPDNADVDKALSQLGAR